MIGEELVCRREVGKIYDLHAVADPVWRRRGQ